MKKAQYYETIDDKRVRCGLCWQSCVIGDGKRGICGVRENREGILYSLVYGLPCAYHVDPIEKKPLFHFFPGSKAFSIATVGCNFKCLHCQNYEISQLPKEGRAIPGEEMTPNEVVELAIRSKCKSISYTYTEPTIFFEYALDISILAKERGLMNNFVTNGYIKEEPLNAIASYLHAANIDLKSFSKDFYRRICGAELDKVIDTIRCYKRLGIWVEITTLIIPGYNDKEEEIREIARFIKNDVGIETPWHVSAFYPTYRLIDAKRTPASTLSRAREIGLEEGLRYVYEGNVPGSDGENTYCYHCNKMLIRRIGYTITEYHLKAGTCSHCGTKIDGIGL